MATRANPATARAYLYVAKEARVIKDFEELEAGRFRIVTVPTRYAAYHGGPDATGEIVLTSREVYAFTEGWWAGRGLHPIRRAGGDPGDAVRNYHANHPGGEDRIS